MKKIISILAVAAGLLAASFGASAQAYIGAGYLNSHHKITANDVALAFDVPGQGAYAGIGANLYLPVNGLSLESGAYFDYLRVKMNFGPVKGDGDAYYVRVPVHFRYEYQFSYDTSVFFGAGPSVCYGLGGKVKGNLDGSDESMPFFDDDIRRLDFQAGFEAGVKVLGHLQVKAGYDWGLMNLMSETDNGTIKRDAVHVGIAYQF